MAPQPSTGRGSATSANRFTPHLLTATGPDNLWGPAPVDSSQIAYGADTRVLALLAVATATHSAGLRQLAGIAAGWFFGQNPAGTATYNPATGATDDGINPNGTVNLNSGAESTIFAGHQLAVRESVVRARPEIKAYFGRDVILGIRPSESGPATGSSSGWMPATCTFSTPTAGSRLAASKQHTQTRGADDDHGTVVQAHSWALVMIGRRLLMSCQIRTFVPNCADAPGAC